MRKMIIGFIKWLKELPYQKCDICSMEGVRVLYKNHLGSGRNVYECKYCKHKFI